MTDKKYSKPALTPALTVSEQIEFLSSQGLEIGNEQLAYDILSTISYYRLSSYLLPFKLPHQVPAQIQHLDNGLQIGAYYKDFF